MPKKYELDRSAEDDVDITFWEDVLEGIDMTITGAYIPSEMGYAEEQLDKWLQKNGMRGE